MPKSFSVLSLSDVRQVIDRDWVSTAGLYSSIEWWHAIELMRPEVDVRYIHSRSRGGEIIVPMYLYSPGRDGDPYSANWHCSESKWPGSSASEPWAIMGACSGLCSGIQHSSKLSSEQAYKTLMPSVLEFAEDVSTNVLFAFFDSEAKRGICKHANIAADSIPLYAIDSVWKNSYSSWDEFNTSLHSQFKRIVRRDLQRFEASGCQMEWMRLDEALSFLPRLWDNVEVNHGANENEHLRHEMLSAQRKALNEISSVYVATEADGTPIAASLNFVFENKIYCRLVGMEYERAREVGAYFQTMYYENIKSAIANGYHAIFFGTDAVKAKVVRGSKLRPLYALMLGSDGRTMQSSVSDEIEKLVSAPVQRELSQVSSKAFVVPDFLI